MVLRHSKGMLGHGVLLPRVQAQHVLAHHASVRRHLLLLFEGRHWMANLGRVDILQLVSGEVCSVCRLVNCKLFIVKGTVGDARVVSCALRHLHRHVACVRAQQRIRLLALLDFLGLQRQNRQVTLTLKIIRI